MSKKILPAPGQPPGYSPICKIFNIHPRKIKINEKYVEFDFRMGTVLVIFSFF